MIFTGRCTKCKAKYSYAETDDRAHNGHRPHAPFCPCRTAEGHPQTWIKFVMVKAVQSDNTRCGAACMNGVSPACICSCGGNNHGKAHRIEPCIR